MSYKLEYPAPVGTLVVHVDGSLGEIAYLVCDAKHGIQVGVVLVENVDKRAWWTDVAEFDSEWRIVPVTC